MVLARLIGVAAGCAVVAGCALMNSKVNAEANGSNEPPAKSPAAAVPVAAATKALPRDDSYAEKLGWYLGTQAWTFRDRTTFEAIDTAHAMGLKYIELYPGQQMMPGKPDVKVGPDMTKEQRAELKAKRDYAGLAKLPRNASPTRLVNRCSMSGRRHGYLRKFACSRMTFREAALHGLIPGVVKASW